MSKVSIIVPIYNVENYLARCLDTCLSQTYEDIEVICINDGSTDLSYEILKHYEKFDSRIKIIDKQNGRLSSARNAGLEVAKGDYILFVDSDDYISSTTVERLYNNAKANDSDVVIFDYVNWNEKQNCANIYTNTEISNKYINTPFNCDTIDVNEYRYIFVATWNKLYKRSLIKEIKFFEGVIYEDIPYWAEVYTKAKKITYIPEPFYYYRTNRTGRIMEQGGENLFNIIPVYEKAEKAFKDAGKWDKYKHSFHIALMNDYLLKLRTISPDLKEKLFQLYKSQKHDIDFEYYKSGNYLPFELNNIKRFELLTRAKDFNEFLSLQKGEPNA